MVIQDLSEEDFQDLDRFFGPSTKYKNSPDKWKKYFSEKQKKERIVKVIKESNQTIGIGSLKFHSDYPEFSSKKIPEVHDVLIAEKYQKQGYGKALILCLEEEARKLGYRTIGIGVGLYQDYGVAQRLYVHLGYVPDGKGVTFQNKTVIPGESYPVDDDLLLWLIKNL